MGPMNMLLALSVALASQSDAAPSRLPVGADANEAIAKAIEISGATDRAVSSGAARGTWKIIRSDGTTFAKASWDLRFSGDKYNLNVVFLEKTGAAKRDDQRRHVICDGSAIAFTEFAPRYHPSGCGCELRASSLNEYITATAGVEMPLHLLAAPVLGKTADLSQYTVLSRETLEGGNLLIRLGIDNGPARGYERDFEISPAAQFHTVRSTIYARDGQPLLERRVEWRRWDEVWWPKRFEKKRWQKNGPDLPETLVIECDQFDPQWKVDAALFRLDALERCAGARLIDRREEGKPRIGPLPPATPMDEKQSSAE